MPNPEKCAGFIASFLSPSKFKSPGSPQRSEYISMYAYGGSATTKCDTIFSSRPLAGQQKDIHILYNLSSLKGLCVKKVFYLKLWGDGMDLILYIVQFVTFKGTV